MPAFAGMTVWAKLGVRFRVARRVFLRSAMSYVNSVLQPGERVIMRGHLHWIVYWHALVFLLLAVLCLAWSGSSGAGVVAWFAALAFGVLCMISTAHAWFIRWITEIAVTDRRII